MGMNRNKKLRVYAGSGLGSARRGSSCQQKEGQSAWMGEGEGQAGMEAGGPGRSRWAGRAEVRMNGEAWEHWLCWAGFRRAWPGPGRQAGHKAGLRDEP